MASAMYDWQRFWSHRDDNIALTDEGYLEDPSPRWGYSNNPAAMPFQALAGIPCLVLLGEPGIGKTTELNHLVEQLQAQGVAGGGKALHLRLGDFQSDGELRRELFDTSAFHEWKTGTDTLTIVLDGLDEGLGFVRVLAGWLPHHLKQHDRTCLRLRLACR